MRDNRQRATTTLQQKQRTTTTPTTRAPAATAGTGALQRSAADEPSCPPRAACQELVRGTRAPLRRPCNKRANEGPPRDGAADGGLERSTSFLKSPFPAFERYQETIDRGEGSSASSSAALPDHLLPTFLKLLCRGIAPTCQMCAARPPAGLPRPHPLFSPSPPFPAGPYLPSPCPAPHRTSPPLPRRPSPIPFHSPQDIPLPSSPFPHGPKPPPRPPIPRRTPSLPPGLPPLLACADGGDAFSTCGVNAKCEAGSVRHEVLGILLIPLDASSCAIGCE